MSESPPIQVFTFTFLGKRMRVVALPGEAIIEEHDGCDALGVERWRSVDLEAHGGREVGRPRAWPHEWVSVAVLAALGRGPQA